MIFWEVEVGEEVEWKTCKGISYNLNEDLKF